MPLPQFSEDDFINFCVQEALMVKAQVEKIEAQKQAEIQQWKNKPIGSGGAMKADSF
jgi:hypothetical protein